MSTKKNDNWPYTLPNKTFVVTERSTSSPKNDSTNDCGDSMIALNQPSLVLKLIPINQVDTVINNDDNSNSFATPRKHNNSSPEMRDTNTTTNQVQTNLHTSIYQWITST